MFLQLNARYYPLNKSMLIFKFQEGRKRQSSGPFAPKEMMQLTWLNAKPRYSRYWQPVVSVRVRVRTPIPDLQDDEE